MKEPKKSSVNYDNESGITLIVLVITIIVLLILASVSINLIIGENGILNKAQTAVTQNNQAKLKEEIQLLLADWQTDYLSNGTSYDGRIETLDSGTIVTCVGDNILVTSGTEFYLAKLNNGQIGKLVKKDLDENSQTYKAMHPEKQALLTENDTKFEHITGTWDTGFVIREKATGDEFVWIPVLSEESYVKKSGSKSYSMTTDTQDKANIGDVLQYIRGDKLELTNILGMQIIEEIVGEDKVGSATGEKITEYNIPEKEVVCNSGGFYVSRYEMGIKERKTVASGNQWTADWTKENLVSQKEKEPARGISQEMAISIANSWKVDANNKYQSGLITGTAWDVICNFIGWEMTDSDCVSWGNYRNSMSQRFEKIYASVPEEDGWKFYDVWQRVEDDVRCVFPTGTFTNVDGTRTDKKNIFDLAGNVWSWTTEIPDNDKRGIGLHRVIRGGSCANRGDSCMANYRDGNQSVKQCYYMFGFRTILYVK